MICILEAIIAWVIMLLIGTNLIGFVVRGLLWSPPSIETTNDRVNELLRREILRALIGNVVLTLFSILLTAAFLFALFHFWNISLAAAAGIIMASRIPDLLWEIRNGRKVTRKVCPKGPVYVIALILDLGALVLVWYSLYELTH